MEGKERPGNFCRKTKVGEDGNIEKKPNKDDIVEIKRNSKKVILIPIGGSNDKKIKVV